MFNSLCIFMKILGKSQSKCDFPSTCRFSFNVVVVVVVLFFFAFVLQNWLNTVFDLDLLSNENIDSMDQAVLNEIQCGLDFA